jgi:hypothetical protein
MAEIWIATENNFRVGKKDEYRLIKKVPVKTEW